MKDILGQPVAVLVSGAAVFVGTLFQLGYFSSFGLEFLSTSSFGDWFFYVGIVGITAMPIVIALLDLTAFLMRRAARLPRAALQAETGVLILSALVLTAIASILGFTTGFWKPLFALAWVIFLAIAMMHIVQMYYAHEAKKEVPSATLLKAMAFLAIASFLTGKVYADNIAGAQCVLSFREGRELRVRYMRSVSDGHLVALREARYYYPKSEVTEIKCER